MVSLVSVLFVVISILSFCLKTHHTMKIPVVRNATFAHVPAVNGDDVTCRRNVTGISVGSPTWRHRAHNVIRRLLGTQSQGPRRFPYRHLPEGWPNYWNVVTSHAGVARPRRGSAARSAGWRQTEWPVGCWRVRQRNLTGRSSTRSACVTPGSVWNSASGS